MDITEKFRPKNLSDVIGQTTAVNQIKRIIDSRGLAGSCWWINGSTGTGKTSVARIMASEFTDSDTFLVYEYVGRDMSVQDVRDLEERISFRPMGTGRAIIINEAQDLSAAVVALLLATVEKIKLSRFDCVIFTAMKDVGKLPSERATHFRALVTRCYQPEFAETDNPVFRQDVVEFINGVAALEGIKAVDAEEICMKAEWSIRDALARLDLCEREPQTAESRQAAKQKELAELYRQLKGEEKVLANQFISRLKAEWQKGELTKLEYWEKVATMLTSIK